FARGVDARSGDGPGVLETDEAVYQQLVDRGIGCGPTGDCAWSGGGDRAHVAPHVTPGQPLAAPIELTPQALRSRLYPWPRASCPCRVHQRRQGLEARPAVTSAVQQRPAWGRSAAGW